MTQPDNSYFRPPDVDLMPAQSHIM